MLAGSTDWRNRDYEPVRLATPTDWRLALPSLIDSDGNDSQGLGGRHQQYRMTGGQQQPGAQRRGRTNEREVRI